MDSRVSHDAADAFTSRALSAWESVHGKIPHTGPYSTIHSGLFLACLMEVSQNSDTSSVVRAIKIVSDLEWEFGMLADDGRNCLKAILFTAYNTSISEIIRVHHLNGFAKSYCYCQV